MGIFHDLIFDYTLRTIALGSAILGLVSGALGTFAVLRKQSLVGDAISHAALPGICLAYLFTGSKSPLALFIGAALAGWLGAVLVMKITGSVRVKYDAALGMELSVFFGLGLMLLTWMRRHPDASQAGLDRYLFGQAAGLLAGDVLMMSLIGAASLFVVFLFWKEFKMMSFDLAFAASAGFPVKHLDVLLATLIIIAVVIGLQTVGVVLMSAMIIAPAAAARQWTNRMCVMVFLAGGFGAASGFLGALISNSAARVPTGPAIILCASAFVFFSLMIAPGRGILWVRLADWRRRRILQMESVLLNLFSLAQQHGDQQHSHKISVLLAMGERLPALKFTLRELEKRGLAQKDVSGEWSLTAAGIAEAQQLYDSEFGLNHEHSTD